MIRSTSIVMLSPGITISTPSGSFRGARYIRRRNEELRPIPIEERRVPPTLFLRQYVHFRVELRVRLDDPRLHNTCPRSTSSRSMPRSRAAHIVPSRPKVQDLPEHSHAGHHRLACVTPNPRSQLPPPTFTVPRSMRPVTTVPRPLMPNTSSMLIRNGLSVTRTGSGM